MSLPNQIIVSGAGTTAVNGTYTKGADQNGRAAWYKDDIQLFASTVYGGSLQNWIISGTPYIGGGPENNTYYTTSGISVEIIESPVGLSFTLSTGQAPAPTVTAATPLPLSPVEERNEKYAVEGEDGEKRFKRLFSLGYF